MNLASSLQTKLALDTNTAVTDAQTVAADTKTMVANTQTVVVDTQTTAVDTKTMVADTQTMVTGIYRKVLTGQEGSSVQNHSVCATYHSSTPQRLQPPRPMQGQRC
jgi:hypothetical protein